MRRETRRSGFTLIELLIVTVVIVTLMGIVFRLAGTGSDSRAKAITIDRLQRLENALSGYYAAYGSYPPVPLQGRSRSIYKAVDGYGLQESGDDETGSTDIQQTKTMEQILAACRAQPLSVSWPAAVDDEMQDMLQELSSGCSESGRGVYGSGFQTLRGVGSLNLDEIDWRGTGRNGQGVQLFEFGLLSFLFPRYLFMLEGKMNNFYDNKKNGRLHSQWAANNQLPCRLDTGDPFNSWQEIRTILGEGTSGGQNGRREAGMISNLTSQAVCARWMPNFKGIVSTIPLPKYRFFYGVDVADDERPYLSVPYTFDPQCGLKGGGVDLWTRRLRVFSTSGFSGSGGGGGSGYILLSMTVRDGWDNEFFYYSEPPYQSYRLWSAGPNRVTFPPWYDLDQFSGDDLTYIQRFIEDDIVHLSN
ncbi:MAG: type II secretion system protein [Kiritimatiellia bacterium]